MGTQGDGTSFGHAINNAGQVVGDSVYSSYTDQPPLFPTRATLWNGTTATDLSEGKESFAYAINDVGQVAGVQGSHATLWNGTTATDLGTLSGGKSSLARAINHSGQVAGHTWTSAFALYHATLWMASRRPPWVH